MKYSDTFFWKWNAEFGPGFSLDMAEVYKVQSNDGA
jgi:hypothetical protein